MAKSKSLPSISDAYRKAWESCMALWPIFFVRLVFLILNFGALIFCLFLGCWPLVMGLINAWKESGGRDFPQYLQGMDWNGYFPDFHFVLMAIGLGLLYLTWWSLLAAMFDGAVYSRMREHQEKGSVFSLAEFFKDGIHYMFPMLGLQVCWSLIFLGITLAGTLFFLLVLLMGHLLSIPWWVGLILALPGGFGVLLVTLALATLAVLGGAYLMEDKGVFHALKAAWAKTIEKYGRVIWALLLLWIIYCVFSLAFDSVMDIFGSMRWIGFIFLLAEFGVNLFFSVVIWLYMPALAVAFSLEEEA